MVELVSFFEPALPSSVEPFIELIEFIGYGAGWWFLNLHFSHLMRVYAPFDNTQIEFRVNDIVKPMEFISAPTQFILQVKVNVGHTFGYLRSTVVKQSMSLRSAFNWHCRLNSIRDFNWPPP